ncbi:MAG TPA: hypothetical protein VKQ08_06220 [Cyclobacteriaceae bacterium]|nr:hypothetical protein [Cyclobacteriaceae bacterium]
MQLKFIFTFLVCLSALIGRAQSTRDVMIGGGLDVIKSGSDGLLQRAQVGLEAHYFVQRHFAVGIGTELWTRPQKNSFMMGMRWYANDHVFVRFRGLIGTNDVALGLGYAKPLSQYVRLDCMGDFYFAGAVGLRGGISYILR